MAVLLPGYFRGIARQSIADAKAKLASGEVSMPSHAALDLRHALEILALEYLYAYRAEIPIDKYTTWQPREIVALLAKIDPTITMDQTFSLGRDEDGLPPTKMSHPHKVLALTPADIKGLHESLSSFLHAPTLNNLIAGVVVDETKVRSRCERTIAILERVLSSKVWLNTIGYFTGTNCLRCGELIRRRISTLGTNPFEAKCLKPDCPAEYVITRKDSDLAWAAKREVVKCATAKCAHPHYLWPDEIRTGTAWNCAGCGRRHELELMIMPAPLIST